MPNRTATLTSYDRFEGYHPYSASIINALAHAGVVAPHTRKPYTEALLAGIAGGAAVGYFFFHYEGSDPQLNILTRNSFNDYGFDAICSRLSIAREMYQTTSADKARDNLIAALERGEAPLVWADVFTLGYEYSDLSGDMWAMQPLVVLGYEEGGDAQIADRSDVPITVPAKVLDDARAKVKKERYKLATLSLDEKPDLAAAAGAGIGDCLQLYIGTPPAGSAKNWGLKALESWRDAAAKTTGKTSWHKLFPEGRRALAALTSAYRYSTLFWKTGDGSADRSLMVDFLEESADIAGSSGGSIDVTAAIPGRDTSELVLSADTLRSAAEAFRSAAKSWIALGPALLPDDIPPLKRAREIMDREHELFLSKGAGADTQRSDLWREYETLKADTEEHGELDYGSVMKDHFSRIAEAVEDVRIHEAQAVRALQAG